MSPFDRVRAGLSQIAAYPLDEFGIDANTRGGRRLTGANDWYLDVQDVRAALAEIEREYSESVKFGASMASKLAIACAEAESLRAKLTKYEQAPTIGVIRDVGSRPYCDWKVSQATLPKSGAEIIARPTRKDGE